MTARVMLRRMLDATPLPPPGADVDALLAAFAVMTAERQILLDALSSAAVTIDVTEPAVLAELRAREAAWRDAIAATQAVLGEQRRGVSKVRGYTAGL